MTDFQLTQAASIRHRFHAGRIDLFRALADLVVLGFTADNADRYLRCLPQR